MVRMSIETPAVAIATEVNCKNCGAALSGKFCSQCGQPDKHSDPTFHEFLHELVHEFLHLDGKIFATLKALILKPGLLSADYFAGRRAWCIGAVRLYLTFSVLFFVVSGWHTGLRVLVDGKEVPDSQLKASITSKMKPSDTQGSSFSAHLNRMIVAAADNPELVRHTFLTNISRVMFLLVPLFALGLWIVYRKHGKHYPAFLYFSLHYHAFLFVALTVVAIAQMVKSTQVPRIVAAPVAIWIMVYLFIALRRVFGGSRMNTALRMVGLAVFYLPCLALAFVGLQLATIYSY